MSSTGDIFVVLPENCAGGSLIVGRNAQDESALGVAQEVIFYEASEVLGESDGGASVNSGDDAEPLRVILQKPKPGVWGGDFGANERNVTVAISWNDGEGEAGSGTLLSTDIVRLTLAVATSAQAAVTRIGALVTAHNIDTAKLNLVACDAAEAWLISCAGKVWAAQQLKESYQRVPSGGLAVTTTIDKSSDGVDASNNFAAAFDAEASTGDWCGPTPAGDASYTQASMFETLRAAANAATSRSATVSVLSPDGISCHWFTATPNASESVFKPFVFAPQPKISPLTKVPDDSEITLLHKLHAQRKPAALDDLKALEVSCVEELNAYLAEHPAADEELDELLKDCVEAEVKFYR